MHSDDDAPTQALRQELQARASQAVLERVSRDSERKDIFIATIAHELRNMMAPLDAALEILDRGQANPELLGRALPVARRQVRHICQLVDDLLDVGRIVNDQVLLDRTPLLLQQLLDEGLSACAPLFSERQQQVSTRICSEPAWIRGDALRWAQVITNLLHNAGKFTQPGGSIDVSLQVDDEAHQAELRVADNGCGIARSELEAIFGIFRRERRTRGRPGLGIGLALVRRLVELHGGRIHAESAGPDRGATFVVRVPLMARRPRGAAAGIRAGRTLHA
ncbi:HAMP domain-containing sensor histidine kinase [Ramlibacter tataouinensis]|uniref:sensor histidine kinase n=1 Tax=Ramlibacter tataouinensis TaxID=94132 RepID=UPI0022F3C7AE|nr:HAMP domain-containing sensor histidine kinase [Ramlibacter tataouinensis]WBY02451.1 HAMP domain-containing sensor histidine kinase [Ramlibacter tataouinensis]